LVTSSAALEANLGLELRKLNGLGLDCGFIASNRLKGLFQLFKALTYLNLAIELEGVTLPSTSAVD
jgi:hypothetical protein